MLQGLATVGSISNALVRYSKFGAGGLPLAVFTEREANRGKQHESEFVSLTVLRVFSAFNDFSNECPAGNTPDETTKYWGKA